jgi:archaellum component FlaC
VGRGDREAGGGAGGVTDGSMYESDGDHLDQSVDELECEVRELKETLDEVRNELEELKSEVKHLPFGMAVVLVFGVLVFLVVRRFVG